MKIIGCMAPEIWRNRVFCQFGPFLLFEPPNNHKNQNFQKSEKQHLEILAFHTCVSQKAIIWSMVPEILSARDRFFVILGYVLSFYPTINLKNKTFDKMKTMPGYIIILHLSTTNDNHIMYGSWDMECNRHSFFVTLDYFLPFYPLQCTSKCAP